MAKYYYIYKVTCLCGSLKGHYYFGQHRTDNLNDGYAGSGNIIQYYYNKHGKIEGETYVKEILKYANSPEELNDLEREIIGDKFLNDPLCINLKCGGYCSCGEYNTFFNKHHSEKSKKKMSESQRKRFENKDPWMKGKKFTEEQRKKISIKTKEGMHKEESWVKYRNAMEAKKGTHLTEEHKKKISETFKIRGSHVNGMKGKHHTEEAKNKIRLNNKGKRFSGHHHSEETRKKMSESRKGCKHPMYGKTGANAGKHRVYNPDGTYKYVKNTLNTVNG